MQPKAEAALRKLIQLKPADATGYRSLAQIYLTSGQKRELAEKLAPARGPAGSQRGESVHLRLGFGRKWEEDKGYQSTQSSLTARPGPCKL